MVSVVLKVEKFDEWFAAYEKVDHEALGVVKSFVGEREAPAPAKSGVVAGLWNRVHEPEHFAVVVHVVRFVSVGDVRAALAAAPYGEAATETVWSRVVSELDYDDLKTAELLVAAHHGVRDFPRWLEDRVARERAGAFEYQRVAKTIIGEVQPGCAGVHTVHLLPRDTADALDLDFEKPPFVGGDDLIKRGDVLRPFNATTARLEAAREAPLR